MATLESMQRMQRTTQWLASALAEMDLVAREYPDGEPAKLAQAAKTALDELVAAVLSFESVSCKAVVDAAAVAAVADVALA